MSLQTKLSALISAIGADIKQLKSSSMTKSVDLLISPMKFDTVTMTVADSSFAAGMLVNASLVANRDHDMDDLTDVRLMACAVDGGVEFTLCTTGMMVGTYTVLYNKG